MKDLPGPPFGVRPYIMAEDPQEPLRCFTAAAHRFREVQNLFRLTAEHISVSGELSLLADVAAPPPRNPFSYPKGGQVIKVKQSAAVRRDGPTPSGKNNHSQHFRKANAKNSFRRTNRTGRMILEMEIINVLDPPGRGLLTDTKVTAVRHKRSDANHRLQVRVNPSRNKCAEMCRRKSTPRKARKKSGAISKKKANRARNRARKKK